ncbi:MAG: competence/damage-inducible protein A [Candidatus Kuenenia sp.]|nr:competence/damage-inducible protein A [Candidatus Kuenenia hertensis]
MTTAEIITIGTEIVLGQIVDTNTAYIAETLTKNGIHVLFTTSVRDDAELLKSALNIAKERVQLIITTGGLGPTENDITRETVSHLFNMPLIPSSEPYANIPQCADTLHESAMKLKSIPAGALVIPNEHGTAIGFALKHEQTDLVCLPGVPREMHQILSSYLKIYKAQHLAEEYRIVTRQFHTFGMPEFEINKLIKECDIHRNSIKTMTLVHDGIVTVNVSTSSLIKEDALQSLDTAEKTLRKILGQAIFGTDDTSLEHAVFELLKEKNATIAVAESCTGGLVSDKFTNIPGISDYFLEGIVAYSNKAKINILHVPEDYIKIHGAVSEQVAKSMAKGIRKISGATIGIGITGIAGPGGGSDQKPVGLVYIAIAGDNFTEVKKCRFHGARISNKHFAANTALNMTRLKLSQLFNPHQGKS